MKIFGLSRLSLLVLLLLTVPIFYLILKQGWPETNGILDKVALVLLDIFMTYSLGASFVLWLNSEDEPVIKKDP